MINEKDKWTKASNTINNIKTNILIITLFTFIGMSIAIGPSFKALGQNDMSENESTKINVQVTNNGKSNEVGSIHIISDETGIIKNSNDISFASGETVIQLFDFSANEIPSGTGFSVEVIYGDDDSKRFHGVASQDNQPEIVDIVIP
ncbi:MAG: hypothetical protein R2685_01150 [Candidatus Nitrosocosmicus sp.]|nr:hypothetical protein [Candidatus Nitrosocosmicus sp.]